MKFVLKSLFSIQNQSNNRLFIFRVGTLCYVDFLDFHFFFCLLLVLVTIKCLLWRLFILFRFRLVVSSRRKSLLITYVRKFRFDSQVFVRVWGLWLLLLQLRCLVLLLALLTLPNHTLLVNTLDGRVRIQSFQGFS